MPGIPDGALFKLSGLGNKENSELPPGDLIVRIIILNHKKFQRSDDDLIMELEIPIATSLLGGKTSVESLNGDVLELSIPERTSHGKKLRMKGQGMKKFSGAVGDLYMIIKVVYPKNLTSEQKTLLQKFDELEKAKL